MRINWVRAVVAFAIAVVMITDIRSARPDDLLGISISRVPSLPRTDQMRLETSAEHYWRVREMVRRENDWASVSSWVEAVSGTRLWYRNSLADDLGVPAWQYHQLDPRWTEKEANDATSFDYAVTGYALFEGLSVKHSWSWLNDDAIRLILRAGSAFYQRQDDLRQFRVAEILTWGRTWYFEDQNDVASLNAGFEYGRHLSVRESLFSAGLSIDASFGRFPEPAARTSHHLVEYDRYFTEKREWLDEQIRQLDRP